jgi:hypothetical protein
VRLVVIGVVLAASTAASAYPQFQPTTEPTCTGCHLSPAGGGLLNENGLAYVETTSTWGGTPEAAHGKLAGWSWLTLGGDFRGGAGLVQNTGSHPAAFPMQAELDADFHKNAFSFYATLGGQSGDTSRPQTFLLFREHYVMWQDDGLYVRVGRFMPVFGLRFAEHNDFNERYGQAPLYGETYGVAVEWVKPAFEVHVTGFVHDPLQDAIERGNGAATYTEVRLGKLATVGAEARYAKSPDDARTAGGVTAKYLVSADFLLEAEAQLIHQSITGGASQDQVVSYLLGSWFFHDNVRLDVGVSQFDENIKVKNVDLEAFDANVVWFATSNWELLETNRIQTIAFGAGGRSSGYALLQFHYRL